MKKLFLIFAIMLVSVMAMAQTNNDVNDGKAVMTSVEAGRYEILASPIARKHTFKLDKHTGRVWQIKHSAERRDFLWEEIPNLDKPIVDYDYEINFQLFTGGHTIQDTFLINIHTGDVWMLKSSTDGLVFQMIDTYYI